MAAASESKRQNLMRKELAWLRRGAPARTSKPKFRIEAANQLIEDEPPPARPGRAEPARRSRGSARTSSTCSTSASTTRAMRPTSRPCCTTSSGASRRASAPASSASNGAGKSTLLGLVTGTVRADDRAASSAARPSGSRRSPRSSPSSPSAADDRVSDVLAEQRTSYVDRTARSSRPAQLLERLGFTQRAALDARSKTSPAGRSGGCSCCSILLQRAERADPRRADQRPRHRHARRHRGPARLLARHPARRLARPLPDRARHRPAVRDHRRAPAAPAAAASRSTSSCAARRRGAGAPTSARRPRRPRRPRRTRDSPAPIVAPPRRSSARSTAARRLQGEIAAAHEKLAAPRPVRLRGPRRARRRTCGRSRHPSPTSRPAGSKYPSARSVASQDL